MRCSLIREFINTLLEADGFQLFLTQYRELCFLVFIICLVNLIAKGLTIVPRIKYESDLCLVEIMNGG